MDRLKEIVSYFLAAMAMLSLLCAVYKSMNQRLASAGVLAAIFVASALLLYLPQLETFKAFGIEARMQKNLTEAKEILEKVRQASIASAKSAYLNFAWANRWGGISPREKQKALDSVNEQLRAVGVKDEERQAIVKPHVEFIGFDLYFTFYNSLRSVLWHYRTQPTESEGEKVIREWEAKWRPDGLDTILPQLTDGQKLTAYMKQHISRSFINAPEYEKLENLADKVGQIYEGCRIRGGYTEAAFEFIESYKRSDGRPESNYAILMAKP
jgi:hypothetical protein